MGPLETKAKEFATLAHGDQKRKYSGEPYITHPEAVAEIVRGVPHTEEMLAAAWLHDVVEDCGVTLKQVRAEFGVMVAELVDWLTDVSKGRPENRATRKAMDLAHIAQAPSDAQTVKLADLIHNTMSIVANDPGFARVYLTEKAELLKVLGHGDPRLMAIARSGLAAGLAVIERSTETPEDLAETK